MKRLHPPKHDGPIQRSGAHLPAATVQTHQGPAVIQVIDIPAAAPAGAGPLSPHAGRSGILGAVRRRWWLVLLVAVVVGGSGMVLANRLLKPSYEASARVLYHTVSGTITARPDQAITPTDPAALVRTQIELITSPQISLLAARNPELQQAMPFLKGLDLDNPAVQQEVGRRLRGICEADPVLNTELVRIHCEKSEGFLAAAIANAFADAFGEYCSTSLLGRDAVRYRKLQEQLAQEDALLKELLKKKTELIAANNFDSHNQQRGALVVQVAEYQKLKNEAEIQRLAAQTELERYLRNVRNDGGMSSALLLARRQQIEAEKAKDPLLQAAISEQTAAFGAYKQQLALGKLPEHRDVIMARHRLQQAETAVQQRTAEIAAAIDAKVAEDQQLWVSANLEQAQTRYAMAQGAVERYEKLLAGADQQARRLAVEQQKLDQVTGAITRVQAQFDELFRQMQAMNVERQAQPDAVIMVADRADVPSKPTDDKRVKVQAASIIGALVLGVLLAMMVDRFDLRLRDPRDIEPMLGRPMLGMIPRIQELGRFPAEQARNMIAEEFRMIRTQLLFGDTPLSHKTLCITSPSAGDGKTSLAANLAISLAKAGRRVLLIDADLQKPDLHRIFGVDESPGFAELILGSAEETAAIRRTEVDLLDLLPAGTSNIRPAELLSRAELSDLLLSLAKRYEHVVLDSAPLLPVSDTHVLLARVDAVLCTFTAQVDSQAVQMVEEILARSRANVIGSVMNQVHYRQSATYHRGRLAYNSYYACSGSRSAGSGLPPPA